MTPAPPTRAHTTPFRSANTWYIGQHGGSYSTHSDDVIDYDLQTADIDTDGTCHIKRHQTPVTL